MLVKSHLSYILTYVLSAKDRHMMVKMHFLFTCIHVDLSNLCCSIKVIFFLVPPRLTKSGHPFTFTIVNDTTQQTRWRRCPPNQMPTYDRWLLAKKTSFFLHAYLRSVYQWLIQVGKNRLFLLIYLHTYALLVKVISFTYVLFANDQRKFIKSRHFLIYILTFYLRMIETNW